MTGENPLDPGPVGQQLHGLVLMQVEVLAGIEQSPIMGCVPRRVALRAQRPDGDALRGVQPADHQGGGIRGTGLLAPQSADLPDQVPLRRTSDRGVAGHQRRAVHPEGQK